MSANIVCMLNSTFVTIDFTLSIHLKAPAYLITCLSLHDDTFIGDAFSLLSVFLILGCRTTQIEQ